MKAELTRILCGPSSSARCAVALASELLFLAVLFGCNLSYATPMAYQTNLLVMAAAGYRFNDFVRSGLPLVVLMWVTLTYLLALQYEMI